MPLRHRPVTLSAALAGLLLSVTPAVAGAVEPPPPPSPADAADAAAPTDAAGTPRDAGADLVADFEGQDLSTAAGEPISLVGRIGTPTAEGVTLDSGVPADFTLELVAPDGEVLASQDVTAAADGAFATTVPAAATRSLARGGATTTLAVRATDATYQQLETADAGTAAIVLAGDDALQLENSFVSEVGWVKPGETYASRIFVRNPADTAVEDVEVTVTAPTGTSILGARSATGSVSGAPGRTLTWTIPSVPAGSADEPSETQLIVESRARSTDQMPTIVWRDLSTRAVLEVAGSQDGAATSHGPRVIPPSPQYDTARYGDRPFPVVPVAYTDRDYQASNSGAELSDKINSPSLPGSTFNLFQEMSLGQLFPDGTVPSADIATAPFTGQEDFTTAEPAGTCTGVTTAGTPVGPGSELFGERIRRGIYQLPGQTEYYGSDKSGSAVAGSVTGVAALADIDSGCGPTGKLVYDAASIADPEIDYSDYDTDKDGVVDFFMVVFAGCGGNGASQLSVAGCAYPDRPYDNVWPHSSSLEFSYTDPDTGLGGFVTDDQLRDDEDRPLFYTSAARSEMTTSETDYPVMVRVGPYNVNPETAIDKASVISHEYGHSLGLPDFYSTGSRETYGDWNLMATDKSHNMDVFSRQEMGWIVPEVLEPGTSPSVTGWSDSKQDTGRVTWRTEDGTPYTLRNGANGTVHNAKAFVAKLPGRQLIDPAKFESGDGASASHAWWSGSGNDFGCAPEAGHNLDLAVPGLADLPAGSTVNLELKSLWDIEWDYDYGFVLTSTDGGDTFASSESENGYTTPIAQNPNNNACQSRYGNGITGSSGSYNDGTQEVDRVTGTVPDSVFLADSFDVSELAGADDGLLRFSYATDPGLARPGWFIDDVTVTATTPSGDEVLLETDFESDGGPDDPRVFNGGCQGDFGSDCTQGWSYVNADAEAPADHAYYLELRDRSGFDLDGKGENDRDPIAFKPGLSMVYTDEAHGYGNVGTDNPPAQTPLDSQPEPGSDTPDLNDAAWTASAGDKAFSDSGLGHTDNYSDPSETEPDPRFSDVETPWRFQYDCLSFLVTRMVGQDVGPVASDGNLAGDVDFDLGRGCGEFDYGYGAAEGDPEPPANTAPVAQAAASDDTVTTGQTFRLDARDSTDAETPRDLQYSWDFGDGGTTKDSTAVRPSLSYDEPGRYVANLTVTDPSGATDSDAVLVSVRQVVACQEPRVTKSDSWSSRNADRAVGGDYCFTPGAATMRLRFDQPVLRLKIGKARAGGTGIVLVDGVEIDRFTFRSDSRRVEFGFERAYRRLGEGDHTLVLKVRNGAGYVDHFIIGR